MKRLLILLIVLAGGLAWASFAVPTNAASVNGTTISQNSLTADVTAVAHSKLYYCFLNGEQLVATQGQDAAPNVFGAGLQSDDGPYTAVNSAFVSTFLNTEIGHDIVFQLGDQDHLTVTKAELATARAELDVQVTSILQELQSNNISCPGATSTTTGAEVLKTMPSAFVNNLVKYAATVNLLEEKLSGVGFSTKDLQKYFYEHNGDFEEACYSVATFPSLADAQAAAAQATPGTPFTTVVAAATAVGGGGGAQACPIKYQITSQVPASIGLATLPLNTVSAPITDGSDYVLLEFTKFTQSPFSTALAEVKSAVQSAGASKTHTVIDQAEEHANVSIDARYGTWTVKDLAVLPPVSPSQLEVLNPAVNVAAVATAATAPAAPATGTSG
ncbi:MAG TPA: hypothetical protein VGH31_11815 [Acidimicrobiales bacterium]